MKETQLDEVRRKLKQAVHDEHEAWGNVNYWRLQEEKHGREIKALQVEMDNILKANEHTDTRTDI